MIENHQTLKPQSLQITIPKEIMEGQESLEFSMESSGNLLLEIVFEPHPIFTFKKRDILFTLAVTPWVAVLEELENLRTQTTLLY